MPKKHKKETIKPLLQTKKTKTKKAKKTNRKIIQSNHFYRQKKQKNTNILNVETLFII